MRFLLLWVIVDIWYFQTWTIFASPVLICISLMTNDVELLFDVYWQFRHPFVPYLPVFQMDCLSIFCLLIHRSSLYILDVSPLSIFQRTLSPWLFTLSGIFWWTRSLNFTVVEFNNHLLYGLPLYIIFFFLNLPWVIKVFSSKSCIIFAFYI